MGKSIIWTKFSPFVNSSTESLMKLALMTLTAIVLCGCGRGVEGVHVQGTVTFKGTPVPMGRVYFDPDSEKRNPGQQGYADIKDGRYDTDRAGKRPSAGPVIVRIEGFAAGADETPGKLLFSNYEIRLELSPESLAKDISVPASAAAKVSDTPGP